jgi:hypothetical protein
MNDAEAGHGEVTFDGKSFDEIFSAEAQREIGQMMGLTPGAANAAALRAALYAATEGYFNGAREEQEHVPLKEVYRAISTARTSATRLMFALEALHTAGSAMPRMISALEGLETRDTAVEHLWRGCEHPNRFFDLQRLLSDIIAASWVAEDRTEDQSGIPNASAPLEDFERFVMDDAAQTRSRSYDITLSERGARGMIEAFAPHWQHLSTYPFTEGTYYTEAGGYISPATEVMVQILDALGHKIPQNKAANLLRSWREKSLPI